jgi:putative lipase involved disintegration of autophagic bodies
VDIAAISVDYPDEVDSKILPFLVSQHVPFKVYVANIKKDEDFINELNPSWSGAIPATFIFDANGKQRVFMFGQKTLKAFKAEIDSVLGSR